jgi:4,5-epoxidase
VTYRSGPLGGDSSVADRRRGTPRPGDRIPDLACRDEHGEPTRLYRQLAGWALLGGTPECVAVARKRLPDLVVLEPDRPEVLGRSGGVLLVRPDGHLAWRGDQRPAKLARWLEDALNLGRTR